MANPKNPYEFCVRITERVGRERAIFAYEEFFEVCQHIRFSGEVLAVSQEYRKQHTVAMHPVHISRRSWCLVIEELAELEPPFFLTDNLSAIFSGFYKVEFTPYEPGKVWASHHDEAGKDPMICPIASHHFFGKCQFLGETTAAMTLFSTDSKSPQGGDWFWFADNLEEIPGQISRIIPIPPDEFPKLYF